MRRNLEDQPASVDDRSCRQRESIRQETFRLSTRRVASLKKVVNHATDVYAPDAFTARVAFAAAVIARGVETSRKFDTCFEMYDGDAVAAGLMRRAKANPEGNLARNLFRYIGEAGALENYEQTKHLTARGLAEFAAKLRADAETAWKEQTATRDAKRAEGETAAETNFRDLGARNPELLHSCAIGSI